MQITHIDHLVLTVRDIGKTIDFYTRVLGMTVECFGDNRRALKFGRQKINLHQYGSEFSPHAHLPVPGSEDLCLITDSQLADVISTLRVNGVEITEGPVSRTGASGEIESVYCRDPDLNLIEISRYIE
ncbi:MAG: catechol 2,3-dioxygenase-like lactoylglutathione lyase family enzyme [Planctomycetota bacterium]|jgi:catechol 2,3-dioxygenase-like lactoylglutathione lyase family enzyme